MNENLSAIRIPVTSLTIYLSHILEEKNHILSWSKEGPTLVLVMCEEEKTAVEALLISANAVKPNEIDPADPGVIDLPEPDEEF